MRTVGFLLTFVSLIFIYCSPQDIERLFRREIKSGIMIEAVINDDLPINGEVVICKAGEHQQIITEGYTGANITILPGIYDIKVKSRGDEIWITGIEVKEDEIAYRKVQFPNAQMMVQLLEGENHLDASVIVYNVNNPEDIISDTWTEEVIDLPPGKYFIEIELAGKRGIIENITLKDGDRRTYEITVNKLKPIKKEE
ncbi:MAG: hypothetical protein ACUVWP_01970 [bacterium]